MMVFQGGAAGGPDSSPDSSIVRAACKVEVLQAYHHPKLSTSTDNRPRHCRLLAFGDLLAEPPSQPLPGVIREDHILED